MRFLLSLATASFALALFSSIQAAPIAGQGTWETTLQNRDLNGDGVTDAFYDTRLNITWLRNADGFGNRTLGQNGRPAGLISWNAANTWAGTLNVGGVTGWRLPTVNDTGIPGCNGAFDRTDCGWNVDTSTGNAVNNELAHLYYVTLGNISCVDAAGNFPLANCGLTNTANFQNFSPYGYWTGTSYASDSRLAWFVDLTKSYYGAGYQDANFKGIEYFAIAVRSGDVGASSVPVPPSAALMLLALGAMRLARRQQPA
jgi:Protein of unknown function (DUF1566)